MCMIWKTKIIYTQHLWNLTKVCISRLKNLIPCRSCDRTPQEAEVLHLVEIALPVYRYTIHQKLSKKVSGADF